MSPSLPTVPRYRWFQRSFWRLYLHSVVMVLAVIAVTIVVVGRLSGQAPMHGVPHRLTQLMAAQLAPQAGDPARLRAGVQQLARQLGIDAVVYGDDGSLLAAAGRRQPAALSADELRRLAAASPQDSGVALHRGLDLLFAARVTGKSYLVVGGLVHNWVRHMTLALGTILVLLALIALPVARTISRPLERLVHTAHQLAQGDLSARAGLRRRDELGTLGRTMDEMAHKLEATVTREKELLANISHEIRTPLARIRVALEICDEEPDDAAAAIKAHLSGISSDVTELERLLHDVFTVTRLDLAASFGGGAALPLHREQVEPARLLQTAARGFAEHHPERQLELQLAEGLPAVPADPALLRRVVDNLLDNAAKYAPREQPVLLRASVQAGEPPTGELQVAVLDRGPGLAPADLQRVFEPFYRADPGRSRGAGGTGLGLALCRRIVEAHGGRIEAAQRDGGGTEFRFSVPLG